MAPWPQSRGCAFSPVGVILPALFSSLGATEGLRSPAGQCVCHPPASLRRPRRLQMELVSAFCFFAAHVPPSTPRGVAAEGACHSLGQGHVRRVQQKLLPAVGAHQLHRLLVEAHLPETTPSHAHGAWPRLPKGQPWPDRGRAGEGRNTDWGHHEVGRDGRPYRGGRGTLGLGSYPRIAGAAEGWHPPRDEARAWPCPATPRVGGPQIPRGSTHWPRSPTHRHVVELIVRNSLFHQVWLLCGP